MTLHFSTARDAPACLWHGTVQIGFAVSLHAAYSFCNAHAAGCLQRALKALPFCAKLAAHGRNNRQS